MVAIFVLLSVLILISIEVYKPQAVQVAHALASAREPVLPAGLFVHPGHSWAEVLRKGNVRVGLDDLVTRQALTQPDRIVLWRVGETVAQGEPMILMEEGGRRISIPAPISGVIEKVNPELLQAPSCMERNPYDKWAYILKPTQLADEVSALKVAGAARTWLREETQRFARWIESRSMLQPQATMQDGGTLVDGVLRHLDTEAWDEFQDQFIQDQFISHSRV